MDTNLQNGGDGDRCPLTAICKNPRGCPRDPVLNSNLWGCVKIDVSYWCHLAFVTLSLNPKTVNHPPLHSQPQQKFNSSLWEEPRILENSRKEERSQQEGGTDPPLLPDACRVSKPASPSKACVL